MIVRYCEENTGIVGYFGILWNYPHSSGKFKAAYRELFETVYSKKYPDHPFTEQMYNAIASEEIRPGGHFIDFSAPDLSGKVHTLSEEISGKVAVIDLWASWCGPCRRHSMALIPVYEEYKDKGFTVVGVAREQNGTEAMEAAIRKDGYPWLNLVELNEAGIYGQNTVPATQGEGLSLSMPMASSWQSTRRRMKSLNILDRTVFKEIAISIIRISIPGRGAGVRPHRG